MAGGIGRWQVFPCASSLPSLWIKLTGVRMGATIVAMPFPVSQSCDCCRIDMKHTPAPGHHKNRSLSLHGDSFCGLQHYIAFSLRYQIWAGPRASSQIHWMPQAFLAILHQSHHHSPSDRLSLLPPRARILGGRLTPASLSTRDPGWPGQVCPASDRSEPRSHTASIILVPHKKSRCLPSRSIL